MLFRSRTKRLPFDPAGRPRASEQPPERIELDVTADPRAHAALEAYADASRADLPRLSAWLRSGPGAEPHGLTHCAPTVQRVFELAHEWAAAQPDYSRLAWEHVRERLNEALAWRPAPPEPIVVAAEPAAGAEPSVSSEPPAAMESVAAEEPSAPVTSAISAK